MFFYDAWTFLYSFLLKYLRASNTHMKGTYPEVVVFCGQLGFNFYGYVILASIV